jgi:WD40 repeat protein
MMTQRCLSVFLSLAMMLTACVDGDSKSNAIPGPSPNNGQNNGQSNSQTIQPDGYAAVAAGRFSPDGSQIAMVGQREDNSYCLLLTDANGDDATEVVPDGLNYLSTIAWSTDGETLFFGGEGGILRVPTTGGTAEVVVDSFAVQGIDVSADGTQMFWNTNGGQNINLAPIGDGPTPSGDVSPLAVSGRMPRFGPSGNELVYVSAEQYKFFDLTNETETDGPTGADYLSNAAWIADGKLLYLGDDAIQTWDAGEVTPVRDAFAGKDLDYNPQTGRFLYGINGQTGLTVMDL